MSLFRPFLLLFLTLVLLPWGAFHNAMPLAAATGAAVVQRAEGEAAQTRLVAQKTCRGPALPGTSCNPVPGLMPDPARLTPATGQPPHPRRIAAMRLASLALAPPLGPPRPC